MRHNLDVVHIEKNICDSIFGTLLNIDGKLKDNMKSRLDLQAMGIRDQLHPIESVSTFTIYIFILSNKHVCFIILYLDR